MQNIYDDEVFFQGYMEIRGRANNFNNLLEIPAFRALLPDLTGKEVIDLGCGFGDGCVYYKQNGARRVVGIDISTKMIERAKKDYSGGGIEYYVQPMELLDDSLGQFDLVLSSLAFHYAQDYPDLISRISRLIKKGGHLVFSQEHPIFTASKHSKEWIRDERGNKLFWPLDDYNEEGERKTDWLVNGVVNYHRTMGTILNVLIENGFNLERVLEPVPGEEDVKANPALADVVSRPAFLIVRANKG